MVEGEASQEPTAPEGASASPPADKAGEAPAMAGAEPSPPPEASATEAAPPEPAAAAPVAAADWSHLRGFQTVEPPPESRADYAEELHKELSARAARFARSVDDSIVLSSDGLLRWLGDPVARIVSGDELLQPRAVLLADEALTGEDRAAAEHRVGLWLAAHVRKVLAPLFALSDAADLPETAKALGGKIAEALGVLERERVRNDVRGLDQSARGALRKLGVRFGSLYIYVPLLLKPGARSLCSQLWTLKRGSEAGADRLLAFASAGRTSFANEGLLSPDAYRVSGFRLCGERVVRVDIIERLSDLIRAAIPDHMRAGSRPTSEAYGFLITPQMTSLTGCSGEAFASILRSLNFEPVKVAKAAFEAANAKAPTEAIKPVAAEGAEGAETAAVSESVETEVGDAEIVAPAEATLESAAEAQPPQAESEPPQAELEPPQAELEPSQAELEPPQAESEPPAEAEAAQGESEAPSAEADVAAALESVEVPESASAMSDAVEPAPVAEGEPAVAVAVAAVAEEEIEIWRPAPRRPRAPPHQRPQTGEPREGRPTHGKPHRRHGRAPEAAPAAPAVAAISGETTRPPEPARPPRPERRDEGPRRFEGKSKDERRDDRRPQKDIAPRRETRQADPDSPFAKLAALKPLLERRDKRP